MTQIFHSRPHLTELRIHDTVFIGNQEYTVERVTRGGMGFVAFLVKRPGSPPSNVFGVYRTYMVLKSMLVDLDAKCVSVFKRELGIWAGFDHPNIVKLVEILDGSDSGWVAMMHRAGGTVRELLKKRGYLSISEANVIAAQMIEALSYAFEKDHVLHLDIKPENVLYHFLDSELVDDNKVITMNHRFKVSDWGIASVQNSVAKARIHEHGNHKSLDQTMNNFGTIRYMAPERFIEGHPSSIASDVFSIGMMYLEMLTGELPFESHAPDTTTLLSGAYIDKTKVLMNSRRLPSRVQKSILRMIALHPNERPPSHAELKQLVSAYKPSFITNFFA
jgi:serine/threonine protein kinase